MAIGRIGSGCSANIELFDIKYLCWLCHAIFEECWKTLDQIRSSTPFYFSTSVPTLHLSRPPLLASLSSRHQLPLLLREFSIEALTTSDRIKPNACLQSTESSFHFFFSWIFDEVCFICHATSSTFDRSFLPV